MQELQVKIFAQFKVFFDDFPLPSPFIASVHVSVWYFG